ncbi:cytochrome P450 [Streptomyces sp. NPDC007861]|uniref:cytochrome P450 n=1 Tax=Streptomyces sp. NPDC007861 TaxID=3154893 RepID=UPI0033D9113A
MDTEQHRACPRYPLRTDNAIEPSPLWAAFRERPDIPLIDLPTGESAYLLTRYDDVREALVNPVFSRAALARMQNASLVSLEGSGANLVDLDPPEHSRLRQVMSRSFTARRVESMRPRVQQLTHDILDAVLAGTPPVDFITAFAEPVALTVMCELLGIPYGDRARFRQWTLHILSMGDEADTGAIRAREEFFVYLRELADVKRVTPGDDLFTAMITAHDADVGKLTEAELVTMVATMVVAGLATANFMGRGIPWVLRSPSLYEQLGTADEKQVRALVEELLRIVTPTETAVLRMTTQDVELSGNVIPAGSLVIPGLVSANRDATEFADPDDFDAGREDNQRHLAFGGGPHFCLGAALARLELSVALSTLARRVPTLRLAVPETRLQRRTETFTQSLIEVPVAW